MDHLGVVVQKHVLQVLWQEPLDTRERQCLVIEVECQERSTARIQSYTAIEMKNNALINELLASYLLGADGHKFTYLASRQDDRLPQPST